MRRKIALVVLLLLVSASVSVLSYYDGGGSDGWLLPQTMLCGFDGGGSGTGGG